MLKNTMVAWKKSSLFHVTLESLLQIESPLKISFWKLWHQLLHLRISIFLEEDKQRPYIDYLGYSWLSNLRIIETECAVT